MKDRKLKKSLALHRAFSWPAASGYVISSFLIDAQRVITANT